MQFKGFVPQDELQNYYGEYFGRGGEFGLARADCDVGLEVMRHGLPVVAFDVGGIREWLVDGCDGFLVPWMDRAAYAARLEKLLADKSLARSMGGNAGVSWCGNDLISSGTSMGWKGCFAVWRPDGGKGQVMGGVDAVKEFAERGREWGAERAGQGRPVGWRQNFFGRRAG